MSPIKSQVGGPGKAVVAATSEVFLRKANKTKTLK